MAKTNFALLLLFVVSVHGLNALPDNLVVLVTYHDHGKIGIINTGNNTEQLIDVGGKPWAIDYVPQENTVYWTDNTWQAKTIIAAPFTDLKRQRTILQLNKGAALYGIAVDAVSRKVFYADAGNDVVGVVDVDGNHHKELISDLPFPRSIAIDEEKRKLYFANSTKEEIYEANYDGTGMRSIFQTSPFSPTDLYLDKKNSVLYWCQRYGNRFQIESGSVEGTRTARLLDTRSTILDIVVYKDTLFFPEYYKKSIGYMPKIGGQVRRIHTSLSRQTDLHVFAVPQVCDFEQSTCTWSNTRSNDNFDWLRSKGKTSSAMTGPSVDHTTGTAMGYYMFIETNDRLTGDKARLVSQTYGSTSLDTCLTFYYHMYGSSMGSLKVKILTNITEQMVWMLSEDSGDKWYMASANISKIYTRYPYKLAFEGVRDNGFRGDIAIDDVKYAAHVSCGTVPVYAMQRVCDFEQNTCTWSNTRSNDNFDWLRSKGNTSSAMTGPSVDHTTGTAMGYYMFIETSDSRLPGDRARLVSQTYGGTSLDNCLTFYYHMYGSNMGSLKVKILTNITNMAMSTEQMVWMLSGDSGDKWYMASANISKIYTRYPYKLAFEGVRGNGFEGDIAIDDVKYAAQVSCGTAPVYAMQNSTKTHSPESDGPTTYNPIAEITTDDSPNNTASVKPKTVYIIGGGIGSAVVVIIIVVVVVSLCCRRRNHPSTDDNSGRGLHGNPTESRPSEEIYEEIVEMDDADDNNDYLAPIPSTPGMASEQYEEIVETDDADDNNDYLAPIPSTPGMASEQYEEIVEMDDADDNNDYLAPIASTPGMASEICEETVEMDDADDNNDYLAPIPSTPGVASGSSTSGESELAMFAVNPDINPNMHEHPGT